MFSLGHFDLYGHSQPYIVGLTYYVVYMYRESEKNEFSEEEKMVARAGRTGRTRSHASA